MPAAHLRDPTASSTRNDVQQDATGYNVGYGLDHQYQYGHRGYTNAKELPELQYDSIMKRAHVQFMGNNDILVFYNQLMNGVEHYSGTKCLLL